MSLWSLDDHFVFPSVHNLQVSVLHYVKDMLLIMNIYKLVKGGMLTLDRSQCLRQGWLLGTVSRLWVVTYIGLGNDLISSVCCQFISPPLVSISVPWYVWYLMYFHIYIYIYMIPYNSVNHSVSGFDSWLCSQSMCFSMAAFISFSVDLKRGWVLSEIFKISLLRKRLLLSLSCKLDFFCPCQWWCKLLWKVDSVVR